VRRRRLETKDFQISGAAIHRPFVQGEIAAMQKRLVRSRALEFGGRNAAPFLSVALITLVPNVPAPAGAAITGYWQDIDDAERGFVCAP
jgi:hypothetical protein